ncbi:hypothetical protein NHX12_026688, partial [Muraenolepis orangiensis]
QGGSEDVAPELRAECTSTGITFSLWKSPHMEFLWEIGVGADPLTVELADLRGYGLYNDTQSITLEVPVLSIGYTYQDINLQDFYGTFQLLVRDAKTLAIQSSLSKHCLFQTRDLIVCSSDGTMTVVTTPTVTMPKVQPDHTTLLDRSCRPKLTDPSRALFQFSLNTCGTRMMVGQSFVAFENQILYDRKLLADGTTLISRESKFKLTVRCFYPLATITRLTVDRVFPSDTPGRGFILGTTGSTIPPECPFESSPFGVKSSRPASGGGPPSSVVRPEGLSPRASPHVLPEASSPAGREDVSGLTDNLLAVGFHASSHVNSVESVDRFNRTDVGSQDPTQSSVQKWQMSSTVEPLYRSELEHVHHTPTFQQGRLHTKNNHNLSQSNSLSQSINAQSSQMLSKNEPISQSALYFEEFLKVKVPAKNDQSTTPVPSQPPGSLTSRAPVPSQPPGSLTSRAPVPSQPPGSLTSRAPVPSQPPGSLASRAPVPSQPPGSLASRAPVPSQPPGSLTSRAPVPSQPPGSLTSRAPVPSQPPGSLTSRAGTTQTSSLNATTLTHLV